MTEKRDVDAPLPANLFRVAEPRSNDELFEDLLRRPGVRIERIISHGHTTPPDRPYVQAWDEWVLVIQGLAKLDLEGSGLQTLQAGDYLLIPAGISHRVTYTSEPTIWLAIHIGEH
jgi:cupin 2 domain-containing protein